MGAIGAISAEDVVGDVKRVVGLDSTSMCWAAGFWKERVKAKAPS